MLHKCFKLFVLTPMPRKEVHQEDNNTGMSLTGGDIRAILRLLCPTPIHVDKNGIIK